MYTLPKEACDIEIGVILRPTIGGALLEDLDSAGAGSARHGEKPPQSGHLSTSPPPAKGLQKPPEKPKKYNANSTKSTFLFL